ncbi:MAG: aldolase, partial [Halomonas sp.]|nr:aldolase [Halomonas sp.]
MSVHLRHHHQNSLREQIGTLGKSLFDRGLTRGSSG